MKGLTIAVRFTSPDVKPGKNYATQNGPQKRVRVRQQDLIHNSHHSDAPTKEGHLNCYNARSLSENECETGPKKC